MKFIANDIEIVSGLTATTISGGTFFGDGQNLINVNNYYVTGSTLSSGGTLTLTRNDDVDIDVSGITTDEKLEIAFSSLTSSYFDAYDSVGGTISNTTEWTATVPLGSQRQIGNDFTHSTTVDNGEVTINTAAKYLVMGRVSSEVATGNNRTQAECRLEISTDGTIWNEVDGTVGEMYLRQANYGATASFQAVMDLEVGNKLRITFRRESGGAQVRLEPNGSALTVAKVVGGQKGDKGLTGDLNLNGFTDFYVSGTTYSNVFSGNTQGAVYYGDGSNLTGIIHDITRVGGGTNISTGGTANNPIINLDDDISITSVNATTISGGTLFGDGSNLTGISDDVTRVAGGINISTGGTANNPVINLDDDIVITSVITGSISATTYNNLPKATTAEINTGTESNKLINPSQLNGSKYLDQSGSKLSATATGTNNYVATISPAITSYVSTQRFFIKFTNANTGISTLNLNGLGVKNLYKGVNTPLIAGDILAGKILEVVYDGTNFQISSQVGTPGVISGALIFGGLITPPQLTVDTNNWNPTGLATTSFIRVSTSGVIDLTGIQAPSPAVAQAIYITNIGGNNLSILSNDANSLAANRILSNGTILLNGDESVLLVYDTTSLRWRVASLYN